MIKTQKVRLYPNRTMKKVLDDLCDYRRYCWNQGLALWNDMYDASLILEDKKLLPNESKVRDELVADKADWGKPQFKSKKAPRQGFKTDRAKIVNGRLRLDKPRGIKKWYDIRLKGAKSLKGELKVVSIYRENGKYWASLPFEVEIKTKAKNVKKTARSNNYVETKAKLQRDYRKVANIQHDIVQKFTTELVNNYDEIVIEDLDVKRMQMSHVASKGL